MHKLADFVIALPRRILVVAALFTLSVLIIGVGTPGQLTFSEAELLSHDSQSYRTTQLLRSKVAFPDLVVILPLSRLGVVRTEVSKVAKIAPLLFSSRNGKAYALVGYIDHRVAHGVAAARLVRRFRHFPGVTVGGSALLAQEFSEHVKRDFLRATLIALPLLLLVTFCVFRSLIAMLLPGLVCLAALAATLSLLRLVNAVMPISILSLNLVVAVGAALAIDYSLLLVSRYREELAHDGDSGRAISRALSTAGRTVGISSATVTVSFAALLVFPLGFMRSIAIGCMLVSAISGLVSLVFLPAMFVLLGGRVGALGGSGRFAWGREKRSWYRIARYVMRRPVPIVIATVAVLMVCGMPALGMRLTGVTSASLPVGSSARTFEERALSEFPPSVFSELVLLMHGDRKAMRSVLGRYLEKLPDIRRGEANKVGRDLWGFFIETEHPAFSKQTELLVKRIRHLPIKLGVTGITAEFLDTSSALQAKVPLAIVLAAGPVLLLLLFATGSMILPIKAVLMMGFSLVAACGLVVLIFQEGAFDSIFGYRGTGALALTQPYLLVAATFGILSDYTIFLLTRIKEGRDAGLSNREAVAIGLEHTGRIVTSAALLFCIAVGVLITADLAFIKELGAGIAIAVAIDATIVRALLVPGLMALLGRWNWWRPRWYGKLEPLARK